MSIIDQANHSVVAFNPKTSKPFAGQRLSKVSYKTINDKESIHYGIKRDSKCVSIPMIGQTDVIGNITVLVPHVIEFLQGVQDKIVREKIDAGSLHIANEDINIAAMVEWLDNNNESGRLTKETVAKWFSENIEENLMLALAEKLGVGDVPTDSQSKQIELVVGQFKDKVSGLAGGKTMYEPKLCESIKKCLDLAPAGDILASRFNARLDKMISNSKTEVNLIDLL